MSASLVFGPNLRYFFNDGKGNYRYRAPQSFVDRFMTSNVPTIHSVIFGEGDTFFISYTKTTGQTELYFEHENRYPQLKSWLFDENIQHNKDISISLGLNGAFFAYSNQGHRWHNVPSGLLDYYQKFTRIDLFQKSRIIAADLGYNDTYLGIRLDGMWFWYLGNEYPRLKDLGHLNSVRSACLNPFAPDQHFVVFQDGTTHFSLPKELAGDVAQVLQTYATQAVQAPQHNFSGGASAWGNILNNHQPVSTAPVWNRPTMPWQPPPNTSQYIHQAHNMYDQYNNVTNNLGNQNGFSMPDVNDAMQQMQNSVDTINNASNFAGQGLNLVNNVTNGGMMVAQLAGGMAACNVM